MNTTHTLAHNLAGRDKLILTVPSSFGEGFSAVAPKIR